MQQFGDVNLAVQDKVTVKLICLTTLTPVLSEVVFYSSQHNF